jgi:hypothetical protein
MSLMLMSQVSILACALFACSSVKTTHLPSPDIAHSILRAIDGSAECAHDGVNRYLGDPDPSWVTKVDSLALLASFEGVDTSSRYIRNRLYWVMYSVDDFQLWSIIHLVQTEPDSTWHLPGHFTFHGSCESVGICCFGDRPGIDAAYNTSATWGTKSGRAGGRVFVHPSRFQPSSLGLTVIADSVYVSSWLAVFNEAPLVVREAQ